MTQRGKFDKLGIVLVARICILMLIGLTQEQVATVSNEDADLVGLKWYALLQPNYSDGGKFQAARNVRIGNSRTLELMHRVIIERVLDRKLYSSEFVDHIDHNPLNNQRENLRLASRSQNGANQSTRKTSFSGYKGVTWHKKDRKWRARISFNGKKLELGQFNDPIDAAKAYDQAAREYFGEFAVTNFVV